MQAFCHEKSQQTNPNIIFSQLSFNRRKIMLFHAEYGVRAKNIPTNATICLIPTP